MGLRGFLFRKYFGEWVDRWESSMHTIDMNMVTMSMELSSLKKEVASLKETQENIINKIVDFEKKKPNKETKKDESTIVVS